MTSPAQPIQEDQVLRAMSDDGAFRVIVARCTDTVRAAAEAQATRGPIAASFGELLTGAVLYRETMAPQLRVQIILEGTSGGQLTADSWPGGGTRGLVRIPKQSDRLVLAGSLLQMMRSLPKGELHRGVVKVPSSGSISDGLMTYLQGSEQVLSALSVGVVQDGDAIVAAGGYLVQLLPELSEEMLATMTERLEHFPSIDRLLRRIDFTPQGLAGDLLKDMPYTCLETSPVRFECNCSRVRVMTSLATLSRTDIEDLMRDGTPIELSCDYCGTEYRVAPEELRGMLDAT